MRDAMMRIVRLLAGVCLASAIATPSVFGESFNEVVKKVEGRIEPTVAKRGQTVSWKVTVDVNPPWHTYPTRQSADPDSAYINKFEFPKSDQVVFVGELQEPNNVHPEMVKNVGIVDMIKDSGTWERPFIVKPDAIPGKYELKGRVKILV